MFREMRRAGQQLSQEEINEVLEQGQRAVLSIMGEDGYPYGVPIDFVYYQGKVYFHSAREGHKVDALAACDKASLTVLRSLGRNEGEWWLNFHSVVAFGRVRPVEDEAFVKETLTALGLKYFPSSDEVYASIERSGRRVIMYEMTFDHVSGKLVHEK